MILNLSMKIKYIMPRHVSKVVDVLYDMLYNLARFSEALISKLVGVTLKKYNESN